MGKRTKAQIEADKLRTGRPPIPEKKRRSAAVRVRFTPVELAKLKRRAKAAALSVAEYIRKKVLED